MRRAFISLYFLIVISVIAIGWGLDRLWNTYVGDDYANSAQIELIAALASTLDVSNPTEEPDQLTNRLPSHLQKSPLNIKILSLESFAQSNLLEQIMRGDPIFAYHSADSTTVYQLLPVRKSVMRLQLPQPGPNQSIYYDLLLVAFYGSLAVVVFLWMWPLSRDLAKLEKQTRILGKEPVPTHLEIGATSAIYDVATAFKRMSERIRELLASHKEMTYAVSHELRTPLARMKFALEIAASQNSSAKILDKLQSVRDDVNEMDLLVNQLLAYAGVEQGEQNLDIQEGDLSAMVEQLIERIERDKHTRSIQIDLESTLTHHVRCEWCLMERAIFNLLLNAHRFARQRVLVRLYMNGRDICVAVHDDGPGIPQEDRQRVLQSFVRLTNHTNSQARGFGLGLAIVQRVMTWHKGAIDIGSSELGGAQVILHWPTAS